MGISQTMIQEKLKKYLLLYTSRIDGLKTDPDRYDSWAALALLTRDDIQNNLNSFSDEQRQAISKLDAELRLLKDDVALILPTPASTPQARAEGRWWWFLNEA